MANFRFAEGIKVLTILSPADVVATATKTAFVDLDGANWATLALHFGAITCDPPTITVKASTAASTVSATAIAFSYRLSAALLTDTMGAITAATTTGVALTGGAADDGKLLLIDIDPAVVQAEGADKKFIHALITPDANATATMVGAVAYLEPRYPGNLGPSST